MKYEKRNIKFKKKRSKRKPKNKYIILYKSTFKT